MPGLLDVVGFRRRLDDCGPGRRVTDVDVLDSAILRGVSARRLTSELTGRRLGVPWCHGKWSLAVLAGLGNLLSDEVLRRYKLDPRAPARDLDADTARTLPGAVRRTLRTSVRTERVPPRQPWLTGRQDQPEPRCPRCGRRLEAPRMSARRTV
ncbi:hypothetical protein [Streptomyces rubiginosohelvolus]